VQNENDAVLSAKSEMYASVAGIAVHDQGMSCCKEGIWYLPRYFVGHDFDLAARSDFSRHEHQPISGLVAVQIFPPTSRTCCPTTQKLPMHIGNATVELFAYEKTVSCHCATQHACLELPGRVNITSPSPYLASLPPSQFACA
jgi:hypothetical protein